MGTPAFANILSPVGGRVPSETTLQVKRLPDEQSPRQFVPSPVTLPPRSRVRKHIPDGVRLGSVDWLMMVELAFLGVIGLDGDALGSDGQHRGLGQKDELAGDLLEPDRGVARMKRRA